MSVQTAKMKRGILTVPNATKKSWMKNSDMCPFDLVVKRLLVILTRPQWVDKWRGQRDTTSGDYFIKIFGSEKKKRDLSVVEEQRT